MPQPPRPTSAKYTASLRMGRPWFAFAVLACIISLFSALFFFGFSVDWNTNPSPLIGQTAPSFSAAPLTGNTPLTSTQLQGKPYVLNFWASWCLPCRQEAAILQRAHQRYEKQQQALRVVGIAVQTSQASARRFVQKFGKTYSTGLDNAQGAISINYGIYGVPETFFVDAKGIIRHKHVGPLTANILQQRIASLLQASPAASK